MLKRLSCWVVSTKWGGDFDSPLHYRVEHLLSGKTERVSPSEMDLLRQFLRFGDSSSVPERLQGFLVSAGEDPVAADEIGVLQSTEKGRNIAMWERSYWLEETETLLEYRWRGLPIVKMPGDLMFYQEVMYDRWCCRVLELGSLPGGSGEFFLSMAHPSTASLYVGVDNDPALGKLYHNEKRHSVFGCARQHQTAQYIRNRFDGGQFDLIVIDPSIPVGDRIGLLDVWKDLAGPSGMIVVEDLSQPHLDRHGEWRERSLLMDRFLLANPDFGILENAMRYPMSKAARGSVVRYP